MSAALDAVCCFARRCHSWERELNGHTDGLVRGCFPKGTDFRKVTNGQVREIQDQTDARTRKALYYQSPTEVFHEARPP